MAKRVALYVLLVTISVGAAVKKFAASEDLKSKVILRGGVPPPQCPPTGCTGKDGVTDQSGVTSVPSH